MVFAYLRTGKECEAPAVDASSAKPRASKRQPTNVLTGSNTLQLSHISPSSSLVAPPDMMNAMRGGMQVHAVPDNEKAFDAKGNRLPWAFEFAE